MSIWLNLPAADKMVDPYFTMLWDEDLPRHTVVGPDGARSEITIIAGELAGLRPPPPPPDSWAARPDSDLAIWHLALEPGAQLILPAAHGRETVRTLYVFDGSVRAGDHEVEAPTGVVLRAGEPAEITAGSRGSEALVLQGRPIGEAVAQYGPFVMNDRPGIEQAFADYRENGFGGWPWATDDPVHARDAKRFASRRPGDIELPGRDPQPAANRT